MKRKAISKRLRFDIFARDNFSCRYCGRQSDTVVLHIDHIVPVSQGGTNDPENLISSCSDCNLAKGARTPTQAAPNESDILRLAQERNEQIASFEIARQAIEARGRLRQELVNFWCDCTGRKDVDRNTIGTMMSFVEQFGFQTVIGWIELACFKLRGKRDDQIGKYISGIRRHVIAELQEEAENA